MYRRRRGHSDSYRADSSIEMNNKMTTIFITGANRGLGLEFTKQYLESGWAVIATCRKPQTATELAELNGNLRILELDVADFGAIKKIAKQLSADKIDVLLNNAGIMGPKKNGLGEISVKDWEDVFRINTQAPLRVVENLIGNIVNSERKTIVSMSSLLGSVGSNDSGGIYAYRSSKAALNAISKCLSIDLRKKGVISIVVSPGWARTDMGGPNATVDPADSVAGIRKVIDGLTIEDSGKIFNFDGRLLIW